MLSGRGVGGNQCFCTVFRKKYTCRCLYFIVKPILIDAALMANEGFCEINYVPSILMQVIELEQHVYI